MLQEHLNELAMLYVTGLLVAPRNSCGCICQTTAKEALLRISLYQSIDPFIE